MDSLTLFAMGALVGLTVSLLDRRMFGAGAPPTSTRDGGESARAPTEISGAGWRKVALRTWREFSEDRIPAVAAGATFYGLLALFPAVGAFVSLYGLFANVEEARRQIASLRGILPEGAIIVLGEQMTRLAAMPHSGLGATFLVSLLLSLWSSNAGVKALIGGLNVAYEERERRDFLQLNLVSLSFTAGAVVFAMLAAAAVGGAPATLARLGWSGFEVASVLRWPALLVVAMGLLSVLYRYAPSRAHARWRWVTPGGVCAAIGWLAMSLGYSDYVANFGHFDRTYGSLGAVVGFMTWIWLSLIVVLFGAELNAELEQQTKVDTTTGAAKPPGARGAAVADGARRAPAG
ncbi:YihY/virulence factor BrkB family protein [Phenylobacterium sp.]|uniref:YihY/virulence factor BrkB family protein n=1 Tax=Phenylobacterium sp. TaxID=1871053 RepID=UPI002E2F0485|nr:YihY/virulence factor BrkB family protein [Phenylobacterium sp.]HEX4713253.1 YihY/virulence factor BrkB family protein [Phenylobacterium sp.]